MDGIYTPVRMSLTTDINRSAGTILQQGVKVKKCFI